MERERFEDILKERLGDKRVDLPSGMWARIERDIPSAASRSTNKILKPGDAPKQIELRKPRRMRMNFAVAASVAFAALLLGITVILNNDTPQDSLFSQDRDTILPDAIPYTDEEVPMPEDAAEASSFVEKMRTQARDVVKAYSPGSFPGGDPEEIAYMGDQPGADETSDEAKDARNHDRHISSVREDDQTSVADNPHEDGRRIADWDRLIAQDAGKKSRRNSDMVLSLYSGDLGSSAKTSVHTGTAGGGLVITENPDGSIVTIETAPSAVQKEEFKHKMPITFGVNVGFNVAKRVSLESGLVYSYLYSESKTTAKYDYKVKQQLHYLGLPVYVRYDFIDNRVFSVYGMGGGMAEICVSGMKTRITMSEKGKSKPEHTRLNIKGLQTSLGLNAGFEVKLHNSLGLYVEPGVSYYFNNKNHPENYRTENPFSFSLRAGFRVRL